jgi:hypothetical protein
MHVMAVDRGQSRSDVQCTGDSEAVVPGLVSTEPEAQSVLRPDQEPATVQLSEGKALGRQLE